MWLGALRRLRMLGLLCVIRRSLFRPRRPFWRGTGHQNARGYKRLVKIRPGRHLNRECTRLRLSTQRPKRGAASDLFTPFRVTASSHWWSPLRLSAKHWLLLNGGVEGSRLGHLYRTASSPEPRCPGSSHIGGKYQAASFLPREKCPEELSLSELRGTVEIPFRYREYGRTRNRSGI